MKKGLGAFYLHKPTGFLTRLLARKGQRDWRHAFKLSDGLSRRAVSVPRKAPFATFWKRGSNRGRTRQPNLDSGDVSRLPQVTYGIRHQRVLSLYSPCLTNYNRQFRFEFRSILSAFSFLRTGNVGQSFQEKDQVLVLLAQPIGEVLSVLG
jgi:hypothetical protein